MQEKYTNHKYKNGCNKNNIPQKLYLCCYYMTFLSLRKSQAEY